MITNAAGADVINVNNFAATANNAINDSAGADVINVNNFAATAEDTINNSAYVSYRMDTGTLQHMGGLDSFYPDNTVFDSTASNTNLRRDSDAVKEHARPLHKNFLNIDLLGPGMPPQVIQKAQNAKWGVPEWWNVQETMETERNFSHYAWTTKMALDAVSKDANIPLPNGSSALASSSSSSNAASSSSSPLVPVSKPEKEVFACVTPQDEFLKMKEHKQEDYNGYFKAEPRAALLIHNVFDDFSPHDERNDQGDKAAVRLFPVYPQRFSLKHRNSLAKQIDAEINFTKTIKPKNPSARKNPKATDETENVVFYDLYVTVLHMQTFKSAVFRFNIDWYAFFKNENASEPITPANRHRHLRVYYLICSEWMELDSNGNLTLSGNMQTLPEEPVAENVKLFEVADKDIFDSMFPWYYRLAFENAPAKETLRRDYLLHNRRPIYQTRQNWNTMRRRFGSHDETVRSNFKEEVDRWTYAFQRANLYNNAKAVVLKILLANTNRNDEDTKAFKLRYNLKLIRERLATAMAASSSSSSPV
jgi:hypothetical protein